MPGNFYYLKTKDEKLLNFHPDNQSQDSKKNVSGRGEAINVKDPDMAAVDVNGDILSASS